MPSRCKPGALESDPVARDPTRPQQRQLAIKVNAGGTPQRKHQRSGEIEAEIKKENQKRKRRRSCNDPRARRSAPLRSWRARRHRASAIVDGRIESRSATSCSTLVVNAGAPAAKTSVGCRLESDAGAAAATQARAAAAASCAIKVNAGGTPASPRSHPPAPIAAGAPQSSGAPIRNRRQLHTFVVGAACRCRATTSTDTERERTPEMKPLCATARRSGNRPP